MELKSSAGPQKAWLAAARKHLAQVYPGLSWDDFARLLKEDPVEFRAYRLLDTARGFQKLPDALRAAIEKLLLEVSGGDDSAAPSGSVVPPPTLLAPSLAALVVRLAQGSLIEGRMVSGTSRRYGAPVGLTQEDRRAMALVSRACLTHGLPDYGAEIHDLLARCCRPFGEWLLIDEIRNGGLLNACLIHTEEGVPTVEAEELAAGFPGLTAGIEEQLFAKFMEVLGRHPEASANDYYTRCREFVVRHPVCDIEDLKRGLANDVPAVLWVLIQQNFYAQVPAAWSIGAGVPICDHCGNAMKSGVAGLVCRTDACSVTLPAKTSRSMPEGGLLRVARGIKQYWVEPGIDEMRLFDALVAKGVAATLYPFRDRVDIAVDSIGIDLKNYASPETLGAKFKRGIGGLAHYKDRWLVIPDWQAQAVPSYLPRLRAAMGHNDVQCMTVSEALAKFSGKGARRA